MSLIFKSRANIRAWEYALFHGDNDPFLLPNIRLYAQLTDQLITNYHRIVMDSVAIVHSTANVHTRKDRKNLAKENLKKLTELKPFADRKGKTLIREAEKAVKGIK